MHPLHILMYVIYYQITLIVKGKGKEISGHALRVAGGWASQVVRLSAPRTDCLYTPGDISCTQLEAFRAAGRIMSMKNSSDTIGN